jgi:hypothetical protein
MKRWKFSFQSIYISGIILLYGKNQATIQKIKYNFAFKCACVYLYENVGTEILYKYFFVYTQKTQQRQAKANYWKNTES